MDKETKKRIIKMVEESESVIIGTDSDGAIIGNRVLVLNSLVNIIRNLREGTSDKVLRETIELAFMSEEELEKNEKRLNKELEEKLGKLSELLNKII